MTNDLRCILIRWKNKGFIENSTYLKLLTIDDITSKAYGLSKVHKAEYPLRIIVSNINCPLYGTMGDFIMDLSLFFYCT